jgi:GAF domain-containing protein
VTVGPSPSGEPGGPPAGATAAQRALIELAEAAGAGATLSEVLELVARAAATLVPGSLVHVWLAGEDQQELRLATEIGARLGRGTDLRRYGFWSQPVELADEHVSLATDLARVAAVAVANARLYEEARDREAEARALFEVGRLISSILDPERVFDRIVERVLELMHVRACGIFRLDPDGLLRYARGSGLSQEFVREMAVPPGDGTSGKSVAERRPVWSAEILEAEVVRDEAVRRLVEREGYRAVLSVPILTQGAPFGCLATYWWEPHEPTPGEVQTLTSLATLAAVAIENARLYDATRRQVERLERLNHVNRAVSASLHLDEVLGEITRAAGFLCDAPLATVWLADETERVLVRRAFHGAQAIREQLPARLAFGQGGVEAEELQTHGVNHVMTKPFRFEDVQSVVASCRGTGGPA